MDVDIEKQVEINDRTGASSLPASTCSDTPAGPSTAAPAASRDATSQGASKTKGFFEKMFAKPAPSFNRITAFQSSIPVHELLRGYPKLAGKMGLVPESAIFRRFSALNAQSLLYYQAELIGLEVELRMLEHRDHESGDPYKEKMNVSWDWLEMSAELGDGQQRRHMLKIRETLKQYYEALIQASQIINMPDPSPHDLNSLQCFNDNDQEEGGADHELDRQVWGSKRKPNSYAPDLMTLLARQEEDKFSTWATNNAVSHWLKLGLHRLSRSNESHEGAVFNGEKILRLTYWFTSVIAATLPVVSIVALYNVRSMAVKLAMIAAFNLAVSTALTAFTTAKRAEIFAITAAFAAVQVVFVSANPQ